MAESVAVKVEGLRDLQARLQALGSAATEKRMLRQVLGEGAEVVRREAVNLAPSAARPHAMAGRRGVMVVPGNLKRQIRAVPRRDTAHTATVSVGVFPNKKLRTPAFYWRFIEFGTRFLGPRPFLRPAFEHTKEKALKVIVDRLRVRLEAAARARLK